MFTFAELGFGERGKHLNSPGQRCGIEGPSVCVTFIR